MKIETTYSLVEIPPHACGVVESIDPPDDDMLRLMAMGICRGRVVEVIQSGNPMIIRVYGSRIGVSRRLAERVHLTLTEKSCCPLKT